jgi:polyphosphate kinase
MRKKLLALIRRETALAREGKQAWIHGKLNHLADADLIEHLHEAGEAGVKVRMIVRGNCAMRTELCKNIEIVSIVDRNLEHSRIFIFGNGGDEVCYIGSADWMTRNFDGRLEAAVPIYDPEIQREMKTIIEYGLKDNVKARIVNGTGENHFKRAEKNVRPFRSQEELYKYYRKKAATASAKSVKRPN